MKRDPSSAASPPLATGTVLATLALREFDQFKSEAQARKNIVRAIESVAQKLGNTPPICRKCYVHPAVIDAYLDGIALQPEEVAVLLLLGRPPGQGALRPP